MTRLAAVALLLAACGGGSRPFRVAEPMWRDTDLVSRSVPCRPDKRKPGHPICRPAEYESSYQWDFIDYSIFWPISRFFAVDPGGEAVNVNSVDEVPDSGWFENRLGRRALTADDVRRGPCGDDSLAGEWPDGSWTIDLGKDNGANPGFRIKLPDGRKYMLKADDTAQPEKATGATAIAARLYHAAGYYAACDSVVYVRRPQLALTPGLIVKDNFGGTHPFDEAALDRVIAGAAKRGDQIRFVASKWLPGRTLGPFRYESTAADDPNDILPHEDRRDLRGARVFAAWMNHWDSREQNSMRVWMSDDPQDPDASPGKTFYYLIDLGDSFGSVWVGADGITRRNGHAYYLDFGNAAADFFTFGLVSRPWDRATSSEEGDIFAYFHVRDFVPDRWRGGYPNPAFARMTERDGAWAARIMAGFTDELVDAAVEAGDFTHPRHTTFLADQLKARRDVILRRYFSRLSPVSEVTMQDGQVCGVDLARKVGVVAEAAFHYRAGGLPVTVLPAGRVCVTPPASPDYQVITLHNGWSPGGLRIHLAAGRVVGLERPEDAR